MVYYWNSYLQGMVVLRVWICEGCHRVRRMAVLQGCPSWMSRPISQVLTISNDMPMLQVNS